jgi:hypothetical protein
VEKNRKMILPYTASEVEGGRVAGGQRRSLGAAGVAGGWHLSWPESYI